MYITKWILNLKSAHKSKRIFTRTTQTQANADTGRCRHRTMQTQDNADTGQCRHRTIQTQDNANTGQRRHRTTQTQDNADTGQCRHRTIQTQDNADTGQYVIRCHLPRWCCDLVSPVRSYPHLQYILQISYYCFTVQLDIVTQGPGLKQILIRCDVILYE